MLSIVLCGTMLCTYLHSWEDLPSPPNFAFFLQLVIDNNNNYQLHACMLLQRYLLAGFTLATIILFVIAKTTNTLPTTSCGHTWVGVYNGRCITLSLMSILGCSYARYNNYYMHKKFTLAMENLVDAWCIHE